MRGGVGQERHKARILERDTQAALVLGAGAGLTSWLDFTTVGKIAAQSPHIFVINLFDMVYTEGADLAPGPEIAAATEWAPLATVLAVAAVSSLTAVTHWPVAAVGHWTITTGSRRGGAWPTKISSLHKYSDAPLRMGSPASPVW